MSTVAPTTNVRVSGDTVSVELRGGSSWSFHRYLLRDGCTCELCRHPVSGQRLFESSVVLPTARIAEASIDGDALGIVWEDGHRSLFHRDWLETEAAAAAGRPRRPITLWGAELTETRPTEAYAEVVADPQVRRRWLAAIADVGFAVLTRAPLAERTVAEVAELFGHVRTTNYGRIFDVSVRVDATNLADTALGLSLHTDNPYRTPVPTIQLLHCLATSGSGGETILADGFRAVKELGQRSPEALAILARRPIRYAYRDAEVELAAEVPIVSLDAGGEPIALHLNNRSKGLPAGSTSEIADWYQAFFALVGLLQQPAAQVVFRMEAGDVIVFDNLRVLHGRTGFSGAGTRRLQGCYADRDGLLSTLAVLGREAE